MKTLICLFFSILSFFHAVAQGEYEAVDRHAIQAPAHAAKSVKKLSAYLCGTPARTDEQRLRAIYVWITHHILYRDSTDGKELWSTPADIRRQQPEQVLRNGTAVCLGYANLFCALAAEASIPCEVVTGIVRTPNGTIERIAHAWVAAKADRKWYLFDPTWGVVAEEDAAKATDERYFMAVPDEFAVHHLPDDPMWQFLERPLHENEFRSTSDAAIRAAIARPPDSPFHFRDTMSTWLRLDSAARTAHAVYRILRFNTGNERVILQLGRSFYKDFFELKFVLDSVAQAHTFKTEERIDTIRFLKKLALLEHHYKRAGDLFAQLRDPERVAKAGRMYSSTQMEGLLAQLRGNMYMAVWYQYARNNQDITQEQPLRILQVQSDRIGGLFHTALQTLTVDSLFGNERRDIWNLESIRHWTLANRYLRLAQNHIDNEAWQRKHPEVLQKSVQTAKAELEAADSIARLLYLRPWYAVTIRERISAIRKSRITAEVVDIRLQQQAWMKRLLAVSDTRDLAETDIEPLSQQARILTREIETVMDSLAHAQLPYEIEFTQAMRVNILSDLYELQMREGDLYYRLSVLSYNRSLSDRNNSSQKAAISRYCDKALAYFSEAAKTLTQLEKTGKAGKSTLQNARQQTGMLKKAVEELRSSLK